MRRWLALLSLAACTAAGEPEAKPAPTASTPQQAPVSLDGPWRATLISPGGELPFTLEIHDEAGSELSAIARNADEVVSFSRVERFGDGIRLRIDPYQSEIVAAFAQTHDQLEGEWTKDVLGGRTRMQFWAQRGRLPRFAPELDSSLEPVSGAPDSIAGNWALTFYEPNGEQFPGRAELEQTGNRVVGTILTETGDYRFLEGNYAHGWLQLSCFDGGHAFLFKARTESDDSMKGDFWSRDSYHATWDAKRLAGDEADGLADPYDIVQLANEQGQLRFEFPDRVGKTLAWNDPRFAGKVVIVDIFGSWCPNCNDQAPLLANWYRTYRERGLEIVGIAYEFTADPARAAATVSTFAAKHGLTFPILIGGSSNKREASKTMPDLSRVAAYPTTIFIGRDGRVRKIHSGFAGPATGRHHDELVREQTELIERLLAERQ